MSDRECYKGSMVRYKHSVVEVSLRIKAAISGSGDPLSRSEMHDLVMWLSWRIGPEGWVPSLGWDVFDEAVRRLAAAAVGAGAAYVAESWSVFDAGERANARWEQKAYEGSYVDPVGGHFIGNPSPPEPSGATLEVFRAVDPWVSEGL